MISLLNAAYMFGAAAISVPIILHLLRRRPRKIQPFPSFMLIDPTTARRQSKNNIMKWLVLLMRCLILLLLALAFSWPYLPRFKRAPEELTVILWDGSFSMQAEPYRDEMLDEAYDIIGRTRQGRPAVVGIMGDSVQWSGDFSEDSAVLKQWFESNYRGYGTSKLDRALRLADRRLQNTPGAKKRIVLITDRQLVPWQNVKLDKQLSPGTKLELITPRQAGFKNLAIVAADIKGAFTDAAQRLPLRVRLRNYHHRPLVGELVTTWRGRVVDRRHIEVDASAQATVAIPLSPGELKPTFGKVEIRVADELDVDNTAWFVANPAEAARIYVSPSRRGSTDFIRAALAPANRQHVAEMQELSDETSREQLQSAALIVVRRGVPTRSPLIERLDRMLTGGGTVVALWRDMPSMRQWLGKYGIGATVASQPGTRRLGSIDFDHPVFVPFLDVQTAGLFNVLFFDPPELTLPDKARALAHFDNGKVAIAEVPVGDGRLIILAEEMSRSATDWPVSASFLPFWRQLLAYAHRGKETQTAFTVGSRAVNTGEISNVQNLITGDTKAGQAGRFVPDKPGVYMISGGNQDMAVAVNVPPEESDPLLLAEEFPYERLVSMQPVTAQAQQVRATPQESRSFWWMLLVAALALMFAEIILANRVSL